MREVQLASVSTAIKSQSFQRFCYLTVLALMTIACLDSLYHFLVFDIVWDGEIFWFSLGAFSAEYITAAILIRRTRRIGYLEAVLVSLVSMLSMIWMYELFYHMGFWTFWNYSRWPFVFLFSNFSALDDALIASTLLLAHKHLNFNKWVLVSFSVFVATFVFWLAIGYPQMLSPGTLYPLGSVYIYVSNPNDWSYPLNAITKWELIIPYAALFLPKRE